MAAIHNVVQVIVYREAPGIEYLILQRTPEDGGWWQPVTGHIEFGENELEALQRELAEETGITRPKFVSQQIYEYDYDMPDGSGHDSVYMVEIDGKTDIKLQPSEHSQYQWANLRTALELLKYDGNKESLRRADQLLAEAR